MKKILLIILIISIVFVALLFYLRSGGTAVRTSVEPTAPPITLTPKQPTDNIVPSEPASKEDLFF